MLNCTSKPFNALPPQICFQEVPDEVSLAFTMTGCPLACAGCHSRDTWDANKGEALTDATFSAWLERYQHLITCVLFFGGEWHPDALLSKLQIAHQLGLKTCLYTGMNRVPIRLQKQLDYLKTGRWHAELGGLDRATTNQKFVALGSGNLLNFRFQENTHVAA